MYLSRVTFGDVSADADFEKLDFAQHELGAQAFEDVDELLDCYLGGLQRNGQVAGDPIHSRCQGQHVAYANVVRPGSAEERHCSRYNRKYLGAIRELFGTDPTWELLADDVPDSFPDDDPPSSFYLFASSHDGCSPVRRCDTNEAHPSYLIPIDDDERERLYFWSREYNRTDGIWFFSGELETAAYEQLATPASCLSRYGRELCESIEKTLERPVYYYLLRHYGRAEGENARRCPGCGGPWRVEDSGVARDSEGRRLFHDFDFQCEACRLVSHLGSTDDEPEMARFGEFPPPES
ncbi:MAG: DUF2310 family Zn-ribbon-containing protein [Acidobacteriota bacterium]